MFDRGPMCVRGALVLAWRGSTIREEVVRSSSTEVHLYLQHAGNEPNNVEEWRTRRSG